MATTLVGSGTLGNVPNATGQSNQSHLVYGINSARWYLFSVLAGDTTHVNCYISSSNDLSSATWAAIGTGTQSPVLNASDTWVANEGRNIACAYVNVGSTDVVYITAETNRTGGSAPTDVVQNIRVTLTTSAATWGSWASVSGPPNSPAVANTPPGMAASISTTNRAWAFGSRITPDSDLAGVIATNTDSGTSWTAGWGSVATIDNSMANKINSGALLPLASGLMLGLADTGVLVATTLNQIFVKSSSATAWPANAVRSKVFAADTAATQDKNDWAAVGVSTSDIHVIRRKASTSFEHRRTTDGATWGTLVTITSTGLTGHLAGSGIGLATDGADVWMFIIDTDANKSVMYLHWTSAGGWDAAWTALGTGGDTAVKKFINVSQDAGNSQIGVIWTENTSTPFAIVGSYLSTASGSPQTVTATSITSSETAGSQVVAQFIAPAGISSSEVEGVSALSVAIASVGIPSSERAGAPSVSPGAVNIAATGLPSSETSGTETISLAIAPKAIESSERIGAEAVTPGAVNIATTGIPTSEAAGSQAVSFTLTATGITSSESDAAAALSLSIAPKGIVTSEAQGVTVAAPGVVTVTATGIPTSEAAGVSLTSVGAINLTSTGIPASERVGSIAASLAIAPAGIPTSEQPGSTILTQTISATGIPTTERPGAEALALVVSPAGIASSEAEGAIATTTGAVSLSPVGIPSGEALGLSQVTGFAIQTIVATGVPTSEAAGVAAVAPGTATVTASGIPTSEQSGTASLSLSITPKGIGSSEQSGVAAVAAGALIISPAGIPAAESLGTAAVTPGAVTISPAGLPRLEQFGTAMVSMQLIPAGIWSSELYGNLTVIVGPVSLNPAGIPSSERVGVISRVGAVSPGTVHGGTRLLGSVRAGAELVGCARGGPELVGSLHGGSTQ